MDIKQMVIEDLGRAGAFILLYALIFLIAKWAKDFVTSYNIDEELGQKDNFAISLAMSGYYFATVIIFIGAFVGPTQGFLNDLMLVGGYSLLGLAFLNLSRWVNDKFILHKFCNIKQLVEGHNLSVAAVQFGIYVATGLNAAGAVSGQGGGFESAIVFFVLGQISLFLFSYIYTFFTPYNIQEEVEKNNTAAGVAFGGSLIALGVIILNGSSGNLLNWGQDLLLFAIANLTAFIFLPVIRFIMDRLVIPGNSLSKEIRDDKNLGAGILEATVAISFAAILIQLI